MTATVVQANTQETDGTVQVLVSTTVPGFYHIGIDTNLLASGDTLRWRVLTKPLSGGTLKETIDESIVGPTSAPNNQFEAVIAAPFGLDMTIELTAGVDRDIGFTVNRFADLTVENSNTISVTTSELSLGIVTSNETLVLVTDMDLQLAGATTTLRAKSALLEGGTRQTVFDAALAGVLVSPNIIQESAPLVAPHDGQFTVQRAGGSAYNMDYAVCSLQALQEA